MTTKKPKRMRPEFDGEKLVALADTTWDMVLLVREYAHGRASEKDIAFMVARWDRRLIAAVAKPLAAPKMLFKVVCDLRDDYEEIFGDEELRNRVIAFVQKQVSSAGASFSLTIAPASTPVAIGSSNSKIEA